MATRATFGQVRLGRSTSGHRGVGRQPRRALGQISYVASVAIVLLAASVFAAGSAAYAAQPAVGLGTAGSFAVLAGSGITNTGATTITGDVGTFPTPAETGFGSVTIGGTNHDADAVTQGAKNDLVTAYNDAAGRNPVTALPVELGGSTLLAGVYGSGTFGLTGTLTLDAQGNPAAEFIFQAGATVITAANSRVLLINGASACHVVWQVGSSATFNTGTEFAGDVLALTSITAQTGATFEGRLLARNGAVTLDNNVITEATCSAPAAPTTSPTTTGGPPTTTGTPTTSPPSTPAATPPKAPTSGAAPPTGPTARGPGAVAAPRATVVINGVPPVVTLPPAGPASRTPTAPPSTPGGPIPATSPPHTPPSSSLPRTGANTAQLAQFGLPLLVLGLALLVTNRRHARAE
jgi:LPXTG-motif cell wall-anchored protein